MDTLKQKIPEIQCSSDVNEIPWEDAVVWSGMPRIDGRIYEWITREHIRYASWTNGHVSIMPSPKSMLSASCQCVVIQGAFVWVGKNVVVG